MYFFKQVLIPPTQISFNLASWIKKLNEQRYIAVAKGHRTFKWKDSVIENTEIIGFNKIIHHYKPELLSEHNIVLKSKNSKIYVFLLFPISAEVVWKMTIGNDKTTFICSVEVIIPNKILLFLSYLQFNHLFLKRHVEEETQGYLNDILKHN